MIFTMDDQFKDIAERLYRAVLPRELFWKKDGTVAAAAFIDAGQRDGLSVDRAGGRTDKKAAEFMRTNGLHGAIGYVTVGNCKDAEVHVRYAPSKQNAYHTLLRGSETTSVLNVFQADELASVFVIVEEECSQQETEKGHRGTV